MNRSIPALVVAAAVTMAGCTNNAEPSDPTSSPETPAPSGTSNESPSAPPSTPSPSSSQSSRSSTSPDLDAAEKEAADALVEARTLYSKIAEEERPIEEIYTVARGQAATQWTSNLAMYRSKEWTSKGTIKVEVLNVDKVAGQDEYLINACMDASGITTTDKNGDPVGDRGAPDRVSREFRVKDFGKDGLFLIEQGEEVQTC